MRELCGRDLMAKSLAGSCNVVVPLVWSLTVEVKVLGQRSFVRVAAYLWMAGAGAAVSAGERRNVVAGRYAVWIAVFVCICTVVR